MAEPADQPWGERLASVADPDGYVVHIGAKVSAETGLFDTYAQPASRRDARPTV